MKNFTLIHLNFSVRNMPQFQFGEFDDNPHASPLYRCCNYAYPELARTVLTGEFRPLEMVYDFDFLGELALGRLERSTRSLILRPLYCEV